jgi:hypothetical protein
MHCVKAFTFLNIFGLFCYFASAADWDDLKGKLILQLFKKEANIGNNIIKFGSAILAHKHFCIPLI